MGAYGTIMKKGGYFMITNGFTYIATLIFISGVLVYLPKIFTGPVAKKVFSILSPITMIYLGLMVLCTLKVWDLDATASTYSAMRNPLLFAMIFLMLLRCDMKKIIKLGPKMLIGFFAATISIGLGFVLAYAIFHNMLAPDSWQALGALCGSWMGGGGNMLAIQAVYDISESSMVYAIVVDSVVPSIYVMFLLWAINKYERFNKWTKADTRIIDEVGESLAEAAKANTKPLIWQNILLLLGLGLLVSALCQLGGAQLNALMPMFDKTTWTVLVITVLGVALALTPLGKMKGIEEISNVLLYIVVAFIASRADLSAVTDAPIWLVVGAFIMIFHIAIMILLAKLIKMDLFTCCVASLANIGGTATAPVLAGTYSSALVPVGIVMALLGYVIGTHGGLLVAQLMSIFG